MEGKKKMKRCGNGKNKFFVQLIISNKVERDNNVKKKMKEQYDK